MPGIDSFTKLLLHCNGIDGSVSFPDDSNFAHSFASQNNAQVDTSQFKFGGASALFDGNGDYLYSPDSPDWDWGTGDFTIDFWVRWNNPFGQAHQCFCGRATSGSSYFYFAIEGGSELRFRDYDFGDNINIKCSFTPTLEVLYHIAVVRSGGAIKLYVDGVSQTLTANFQSSNAFITRTSQFEIGGHSGISYWLNGWIDEFRLSVGTARWTTDFTPPIAEYSLDSLVEDEEILLSDELATIGTGYESQVDIINLSDSVYFPFIQMSEEISLGDSCNFTLTQYKKFQTHLNTLLYKSSKFLTDLRVNILGIKKFQTHLNLLYLTNKTFKTDLRVRYNAYTSVPIGSLNDFIVKLDGIELTDVDYTTLNLTFNLNSTPSTAEFKLARRHDNLDQKLNGSTSIITSENKIEVYDSSIKLFTGYITELNCDSESDTVKVISEDIRYKLSNLSIELEYGGEWKQDEEDQDLYTKFEKNINQTYQEIISSIGGLISGSDSLPFSGSFVPEYNKIYNTYSSLLDDIIKNTANVNWYIDANERLRFTQVAQGQEKRLSLASLTAHRHAYDVIVDNINLNRKVSAYAKSLNVKRGKVITRSWARTDIGASPGYWDFTGKQEFTWFGFQIYYFINRDTRYVGINPSQLTGYSYGNDIVLKSWLTGQYLVKNTEDDLSDIIVGSGNPRKTIYLTSYGKYTENQQWKEDTKDDETWLIRVTPSTYDRTGFLLDLANFELSQNNKLQTSANVSILLDAFHYYQIQFSDRINLGNTIQENIYNSTNGFPLNIDSYTIDCSTRVVTLNLTNYGKSWYAKTSNILTNENAPTKHFMYPKVPIIIYTDPAFNP